MKKEYKVLDISVLMFESQDIVTASVFIEWDWEDSQGSGGTDEWFFN